jgi:hypothetical protein
LTKASPAVDPLTSNVTGNRTFPPAGLIEAWQACPLRLSLSLVSGQNLDGASSIIVELHGSQAIAGDPPLAAIEHTLTEFNGPWTLDFSAAQMNQTIEEGHTFRGLWMCIVVVFVSADRLEVLATREIKLHRHNASLSAPDPPDPALSWLTAEQIAALYTPLTAHAELENRVETLEESGGTAPHTHPISEITGLQTSLDAKAPLASPALTGVPTAPTASAGTDTNQLATTAFVMARQIFDSAVIFADTVSGNASVTKHGYLPKLNGSANTYLDGSGAWSDPQGGIAGGFFRFDNATSAVDPGNGQIALNASTWNAVTAIYMDQLSDPGTDITAWVELMQSGDTIMMQAKNDNTKRARYQVTGGPTNNSGWFTIPVAVVSSFGSPPASGVVMAVVADYDGGGGGPHTHVSADITDASVSPVANKLVLYGAQGQLNGSSSTIDAAVTGAGTDVGGDFQGGNVGLRAWSNNGLAFSAAANFGAIIADFFDGDAEVSRLAIRRTDGALLFGAVIATRPAASGQLATVAGIAAGYQPLDSDLTAIAALATTAFGRSFLTLADAAAARALLALGSLATVTPTGTPTGAKFLRDDNSWQVPAGGGGTPGGSDTQMQYNNAGAFAGAAGLTWNAPASTLDLAGQFHADGLFVRKLGSSSEAYFDPSNLTGERTHTLPDADGTFATQEWVHANGKVQMIAAPLASLADSRGAIGDMCYDSSTPQYLYIKIAVDPHKWLVSTVSDTLP